MNEGLDAALVLDTEGGKPSKHYPPARFGGLVIGYWRLVNTIVVILVLPAL
jgi:hypothetical protein